MPFGGKHQLTPAQAMVAKLPVDGETTTCSGMAWGFNPYLTEAEPVHRRVPCRGRIASRKPGGGRLQAPGHVPDVPGVLRAPARRRPKRWGKPAAAAAGRAHGAGRPGHRLHRRQGLHVRQLRAARRAAHARVLRHGGGQGRPRDVSRIQGRRPPRGVGRAALLPTPRASLPASEDALAAMRRRAGADRQRCRAGGLHAGLWLHGRSRCSRCAWATASA